MLPERKYWEWSALAIATAIGMGISLWGYYQIINIPPPTSLNIQRPQKILGVSSPKVNDAIKNPFLISGNILIPDKTITIRVKDKNDNILKETSIQSEQTVPFPFNVNLSYSKPSSETGIIEFAAYSPEIGSEMDIKSVLVIFAK